MTDVLTPEQRHKCMSAIRGKNTKPELVIRKELHRRGFRYSLHSKVLPGRPDIVLAKYKAVIQVRGCFWHMHGCKYSSLPKSSPDFWKNKLEGNRRRDRRNDEKLRKMAWRVIVVWECQCKTDIDVNKTVSKIVSRLTV